MVFNSLAFLIFFPVVLFLHFKLPQKANWIMLLVASYFFYISWNLKLIWLILFTTVVSYAMALLIAKVQRLWLRRLALIFTLVCCLGTLFFFKYFDFLSLSVTGLLRSLGLAAPEYQLHLILPVGISFYTFQTLSYVIDVYRGRFLPEKHFGYYALYVSFFPQLVAGPIERSESLLPQLKKEHRFTRENFSVGFRILLSGYVKKIVVADGIALFVNSVFNRASEATGLSVLIAALLFAVQIYCDFSGYTDIAIGCARIMDIRLMKNFDRPYSAKSIKEFWSRWHISLSSWLKDYLYIPLGGNRCSLPRHMLNLFVVFLASGIWHGANWTFILWGALHGIYQIVGHLSLRGRNRALKRMGLEPEGKAVQLLRQLGTFLLVTFAWILFRANSLSDFTLLVGKLFTNWSLQGGYFALSLQSLSATVWQLLICGLCVLLVGLCDRLFTGCRQLSPGRSGGSVAAFVAREKATLITLWLIVVAWLLLLLSQNGVSSFVYFQF